MKFQVVLSEMSEKNEKAIEMYRGILAIPHFGHRAMLKCVEVLAQEIKDDESITSDAAADVLAVLLYAHSLHKAGAKTPD